MQPQIRKENVRGYDMKKKTEPKSLKKRIGFFIMLCWLVPVSVFCIFATVSYRNGITKKTEKLVADQIENVASYASLRIDDAISMSQTPSYEKSWERLWYDYKKGDKERNTYLQEVNGTLKGKFYLDRRFPMYAFYIYGEDDPGIYSSRVGYSYISYMNNVQYAVKSVMDTDSNYPCIKVVDGRIFVIRNLYTTTNYERYGTLVLELNRNIVFEEIPDNWGDNLVVCIDDNINVVDFGEDTRSEAQEELVKGILSDFDFSGRDKLEQKEKDNYNIYIERMRCDNYKIGVIYWAKRTEIYSSLYEIYFITFCMFVLFVPVIAYVFYFMHKQIQTPIAQLIQANGRMEAGNIGAQVEGPPMPNQEFDYLRDSFNSMSSQMQYLFENVYEEKLARKNAQLQALQAQINPHFLNNTLEMMNWQARMSGDMVVSKMIEALGTVLDYRMNRAGIKKIHLAEEMQCTDAYFYIMSMRFGKRLQIEKEIDDSLLYIMVPPLILQPIAENAIVHGVETSKSGSIRLKIYHDEDTVYFKVYNSGKPLTDEEEERIQAILRGEDDKLPKYKGRHTSIGIRNVNKRIQLVYGMDYGLTIERGEDDWTVSTIRIPYHQEELGDSDNEKGKMEQELIRMQRTINDKGQE